MALLSRSDRDGVRVLRLGRPSMPRLGASPGSALVPGWIVEAFYWSFHAPARALVRYRRDPWPQRPLMESALVAATQVAADPAARGRGVLRHLHRSTEQPPAAAGSRLHQLGAPRFEPAPQRARDGGAPAAGRRG